ncbi:hypothetical protein CEXT_282221 [Caerostris extrusa]|uniref:Uncharacterized protein n=1 Tax=Caerostris extrusa TaxID=172846 RepID=A0AAV4XJA7_CAEEX|nr:hypothetical protein CEXT_282221 [Caerostris extrusa]
MKHYGKTKIPSIHFDTIIIAGEKFDTVPFTNISPTPYLIRLETPRIDSKYPTSKQRHAINKATQVVPTAIESSCLSKQCLPKG